METSKATCPDRLVLSLRDKSISKRVIRVTAKNQVVLHQNHPPFSFIPFGCQTQYCLIQENS